MPTILDLRTQVKNLEKQISEIKIRDRSKVLQEILDNMESFELSIRDIQAAVKKPRKKPSVTGRKVKVTGEKKKKTTSPVTVKYLGPAGQPWSGRGMMPKWMRDAIAAGKSREEFSIVPKTADVK